MSNEKPSCHGDKRASVVVGRYTEALTIPTDISATLIDRHIVVSRGLGNLFAVTVCPPLDGHDPKLFDNIKMARGYAGGLRMVHRWAVQDDTGDGA